MKVYALIFKIERKFEILQPSLPIIKDPCHLWEKLNKLKTDKTKPNWPASNKLHNCHRLQMEYWQQYRGYCTISWATCLPYWGFILSGWTERKWWRPERFFYLFQYTISSVLFRLFIDSTDIRLPVWAHGNGHYRDVTFVWKFIK
jgi:hypothetical protein